MTTFDLIGSRLPSPSQQRTVGQQNPVTDALSSSTINPRSRTDVDISMITDTCQDFDSPPDGVVRWAASQSNNPGLRALIKEAECDKRTRPSTPVHESMSWAYPPTPTSLSASVSSPWRPSGHNSVDTPYLLPLSGDGSSSSFASSAPGPSASRRANPPPSAQRKPLTSSAPSANQPIFDSTRPRSSSHSTSHPSTSKSKYMTQEEGPEAVAFIELLKDVSRQLDQNSEKKQRLVARAKHKEPERSLTRCGTDNRVGLDTKQIARPLTKTSSASAICTAGTSTKAVERTSRTTTLASRPDACGRGLERTSRLGVLDADLVTGRPAAASLPNLNVNCNPALAPARTPHVPSTHPTATRKARTIEPSPDYGDSTMQDATDLTETDTEWEKPLSGLMSRTDTVYMQTDDDDPHSDTAMDVSFIQTVPPPPPPRIVGSKPKPKPKLQPQPVQTDTATRTAVPTQRTRTGPPPLGMRRAPQFQPSQYGASQGTKGMTVPRFKPPLLANTGEATKKSGSGTKPATTASSKPPPRGGATKVSKSKTSARANQDADSSFDVSFGVDADALEEAMKAYD